jgi:phosphatidylglycerophosphate synthase
MNRSPHAIWLVDSISLSRLVAALIFSSIAFQNVPVMLVVGVYLFGMVSDLVDGYLARRLNADTYFGKVVDLVSDKSMTIVSLLYAAARGINIFPLALIAIRDLIMIGARIITVGKTPLLPTSKIVGGSLALMLWGNTLFLVLAQDDQSIKVANNIYWACATVFTLNLIRRIYVSARRIMTSMSQCDE